MFQKQPTTQKLHQAPFKLLNASSSVHYPLTGKSLKMKCRGGQTPHVQHVSELSSRNRAKTKTKTKTKASKELGPELSILSLHTPLPIT